MVFSFITPRLDSAAFNFTAQVINARVAQILGCKPNVTIARNDNFYRKGVIDDSLFDEDGTHVNEKGSKILASNTKEAICRALGINAVKAPRERPYFRGRGCGRGRGH